jgi:hypothetical protein
MKLSDEEEEEDTFPQLSRLSNIALGKITQPTGGDKSRILDSQSFK